ncbi:unnamed protein product, partial [Prunus brigantina]
MAARRPKPPSCCLLSSLPLLLSTFPLFVYNGLEELLNAKML